MPAWGRPTSVESKIVWPEERATSLSLRWITQNIPHTPIEEGWQMDELRSRKPAMRPIMVRAEGTLCRVCRVNFQGPGTRWSMWRMLSKVFMKNLGGANIA